MAAPTRRRTPLRSTAPYTRPAAGPGSMSTAIGDAPGAVHDEGGRGGRTPIEYAALGVGIAFLVVGILGYIPGITTDYDEMRFAGHESQAQLLGIFQVSVLHNLVHVAFGLIGIGAARRVVASRWYLFGGGLVYLVLFVYGAAVDKSSDANVVPVDTADDRLHLVLGAGMALVAIFLWKHRTGEAEGPALPVGEHRFDR